MEKKERGPVTHALKTWPDFFQSVVSGAKRFELRKNDRDFRCGDYLLLQEWVPVHSEDCDCGCEENGWKEEGPNLGYTGREERFTVYSIVFKHEGLAPGFVIMGISPLESK